MLWLLFLASPRSWMFMGALGQMTEQAVLFWEKLPLESGSDFPALHSLLRAGGGKARRSGSSDGAMAMGALCLLWLTL